MHWRDIPFQPPTRTLRVFGFGLAILLTGFASWQYFVEDRATIALVQATLAVVIGIVGWTKPSVLQPIFVGWMIAIFPANWLVTYFLLACMFYLMITPLGLFFRLIGRDFLDRRIRPDQETYWSTKPTRDDVESYLRPF